ncbi:MAG: DUF4442 domain-containing protein [Chitinophagaceae bacterium]
MNTNLETFIKLMKHPVKFRMFLFSKLPSAYFAGIKIRELESSFCAVSVPYKWFSQNPFRSTYFACLGMAAEMSTGALAMAHLYKINPPVSMLVTAIEGSFIKKATDITIFICEDGELIRQTIADAIESGQGNIIRAKSIGKNKAGEVVATFYITWSFKKKSSR